MSASLHVSARALAQHAWATQLRIQKHTHTPVHAQAAPALGQQLLLASLVAVSGGLYSNSEPDQEDTATQLQPGGRGAGRGMAGGRGMAAGRGRGLGRVV